MAKNQGNTKPAEDKKTTTATAAPASAPVVTPPEGAADNITAPPTPDAAAAAAALEGKDPLTDGPGEGNEEVVSQLFRVSQPIAVLIVNGKVNIQPLLDALADEVNEVGLPEGFPELSSITGNLEAIVTRYASFAEEQKLDLANVLFTVADPLTDSTLKSINFMRSMQGLVPTYFYPDILDPVA